MSPVRKTPTTTWQCPKCTWFRTRSLTDKASTQLFEHPIHGWVTSAEAYRLDVLNHNCELTRFARIRYGIDPDVTYKRNDNVDE